MSNQYLINGKESSGLNPFDRGLAFGDGVFRTIKIQNGAPKFWKFHYEILSHDARSIRIDIPSSRILLRDIKKLFSESGDFVAKFIITRGISERGYQFKNNIKCTRILLKNKFIPVKKEIVRTGVSLQVCKQKLSENFMLSGIKHLNRLENVIAKTELERENFDGILLDSHGHVNECISSTIIIRAGDTLYFPNQNGAGVSGVTKRIVMDNASYLGYKVKIKNILLDDLMESDEVVITNSIIGAIPVHKINNKKWKFSNLAYEINKIFESI
ncbi:MAG: aminodeoxychorismate lyase [Methylophilaceae bacterium]|nr:aminodeoxychorismate lyase [Methylophilaceae bacterium]